MRNLEWPPSSAGAGTRGLGLGRRGMCSRGGPAGQSAALCHLAQIVFGARRRVSTRAPRRMGWPKRNGVLANSGRLGKRRAQMQGALTWCAPSRSQAQESPSCVGLLPARKCANALGARGARQISAQVNSERRLEWFAPRSRAARQIVALVCGSRPAVSPDTSAEPLVEAGPCGRLRCRDWRPATQ